MSKKPKISFDDYFSNIYELSWPSLKLALLKEKSHIVLNHLSQDYFLDAASTLPPAVLDVQEHDHVLDMCAAPGGKALQLALALSGSGELQLNELSRNRRERLKKVISQHLDQDKTKNIKFSAFNAERMGLFGSEYKYDKILLDAPCSSERHVLENEQELSKWSPARTKNLANRQMAMLCSALSLLKPGGAMVYSTCSISPKENHELIQAFLKKRNRIVELDSFKLPYGEPYGNFGYLVRPDLHEGKGPMFISKLRKRIDD